MGVRNFMTQNSMVLYDSISCSEKFSGSVNIKGHLNAYKNGVKIIDDDNHIVITGRHYLMQRLFGLAYNLTVDQHLWTPKWFSVGSGGAAMDTPFQQMMPTDEDTGCYHENLFNATGGARYTTNKSKKLIDSIEFVSALSAKMTMTLAESDCVNSYVNEAAFFVSPSENQNETLFSCFSHICFPTFPKGDMDSILFEWYLIF